MGSSPETWHVEQFTSHFITELTIFINLSDPRMFAYLHLHFLALAVSAFFFKRYVFLTFFTTTSRIISAVLINLK